MGQPVVQFGPAVYEDRAPASDGDRVHESTGGRGHMRDSSKGTGVLADSAMNRLASGWSLELY